MKRDPQGRTNGYRGVYLIVHFLEAFPLLKLAALLVRVNLRNNRWHYIVAAPMTPVRSIGITYAFSEASLTFRPAGPAFEMEKEFETFLNLLREYLR